jgi:predicted HicB family RNase H-like nuclease
MGRPATKAADYVHFPLRLPKELMDVLRAKAAESGAPINTEVVRALRRDLQVPAQQERRRRSATPA